MTPEQEHKLWKQHGYSGAASPSTTRTTEQTKDVYPGRKNNQPKAVYAICP